MKKMNVILLGIGLLTLLIGGALMAVACDQIMRDHEALVRLREDVAELKSIPVQQRIALEANKVVWRQSDVEYFEGEILPRDYVRLACFFAILVAGSVCCAIALMIGHRKQTAISG